MNTLTKMVRLERQMPLILIGLQDGTKEHLTREERCQKRERKMLI